MLDNARLQELKNELKEMLTGINWHGEKGKRYWSFWIRDHANSVVPDLLSLIDSAMKPVSECKHKGVDGKCRLPECAPDYIEYCVEAPCPNYADSAMKPVSDEVENAIKVLAKIWDGITNQYLKENRNPTHAKEDGEKVAALALAIQALKQYQPKEYCSQDEIEKAVLQNYNDGGEGLIKHVKRRLAHEVADDLVDDGYITFAKEDRPLDQSIRIRASIYVTTKEDE